ncbi:hypothetical protein [Pseudomonas sp. C11]|jgi:hypothetical protein|uniref:hypothetical protein n=1 Tax=Pseudomonas sp. C11 TaxID=3075550 RepID=UPI002AFE675B|nr:hypothetical protein [Pseudomonas sp. C11]
MKKNTVPPPFHYRISGLNVASDIELPMRSRLNTEDAQHVDVTLHVNEVPTQLSHPTRSGPNWSADETSFLLDLPGIGRFIASNGQRLTLQPADGIPLDDILVFATGTALAGILYQRGALLLHGSSIVHEGRAFVFCGPSGAGKSTLAAALNQAGCSFLADDVCSIELVAGAPRVHADGRALRLYADSIGQVGLKDAVGPKVRMHIEKFHVQPSTSLYREDGIPLAAIYMLSDSNAASPPGISRLPSLTAAQALLRNTYRRRLALAYSSQGQLATQTAALLSSVPVFRLHRPRDFDCLAETVESLQTHWGKYAHD